MYRKLFLSLSFVGALLLSLSPTATIFNNEAKAEAATIIVPYDYSTIQEAIDAASHGDTIHVEVGTYHENIVLDKALTLHGDNPETTVIDGGGTSWRPPEKRGIWVRGDLFAGSWKVEGFKIQNSYRGIYLYNCGSSTSGQILGNIIRDNSLGIYLKSSNENTISGNTITGNSYGIELWKSSENNIVTNHVYENVSGILVDIYGGGNSGNNISKNTVESNSNMGIDFGGGSGGVIEGNTVKKNHYGIALRAAHNFKVKNNIVSGNDFGITILIGSSHNEVFANHVEGNEVGVTIGCSEHYNTFNCNSFISNDIQAKDYDSYNSSLWDDGYPSGGNYWSDYTGDDQYSGPNQDLIGSDGLGDTPHPIYGCAGSVDHYPRMEPDLCKPKAGSISGYKYRCDSSYVDIGDTDSESQVVMDGWGPIEPTTSGGGYGGIANCRCIWDKSDDNPEAMVTFTLPATLKLGKLKWRALDGIADDSYKVWVNGVEIYEYTDQYSTETWLEFEKDLSTLPKASTVTVKFEAIGPKWSGFDTYGQMAFDWIELKYCSEEGIKGWTIILSGYSSGFTTTNDEGYYAFTDLDPGSYTVTETLEDGWAACTPTSIGIVLSPGQNSENNNFCNWEVPPELGSISGYKWADCNENGEWDNEELGLPGWEIKLYKNVSRLWVWLSSTTTCTGGAYSFTGLEAGEYKVEEVLQEGWTQTSPESPGYYTIDLAPGQYVTKNFGNSWAGEKLCASGVVEYDQGQRKDGSMVLAQRSDPTLALGPPDSSRGNDEAFFSLGYGGYIILEFPDLISGSITVYEATWGEYPLEKSEVHVSENLGDWIYLGEANNSEEMPNKDIHPTTFTLPSPVKYVKIVDTTNPAPHNGSSDAFDLDAVCVEYFCASTVEKTFELTVTNPDAAPDGVKYYAVLSESEQELIADGGVYSYTFCDLSPGTYTWKIYAAWDESIESIASGEEEITESKTNEVEWTWRLVTSLELKKTVDSVKGNKDNTYIITGQIIVTNTGEHPAIVTHVSDTIEYKKPKGPEWGSIIPSPFTHYVPDKIPLEGGTYSYSLTFDKDDVSSNAWRNLIEITISNHPEGSHTFHYRADFELPKQKKLTQLEVTYKLKGSWWRKYVVLKAKLTDSNSGEPIRSQYVSFFIDGCFRGKIRTKGNGLAKYSLRIGRRGKTHSAYAVFKGNSEYETSTSDKVTWREQRPYYYRY